MLWLVLTGDTELSEEDEGFRILRRIEILGSRRRLWVIEGARREVAFLRQRRGVQKVTPMAAAA